MAWLRVDQDVPRYVCCYAFCATRSYYNNRETGRVPLNAVDMLALANLYPGLCLVWLLTGKGIAFPCPDEAITSGR